MIGPSTQKAELPLQYWPIVGVGDGAEAAALLRPAVEVAIALLWARTIGNAAMAKMGRENLILIVGKCTLFSDGQSMRLWTLREDAQTIDGIETYIAQYILEMASFLEPGVA